jgi:two-component system sensor histidine kinase QseC
VLAVLAACGLVWVAIYIEGLVLVQYNGSGNFDRDMATVASALREVAQHHPEEAALRLALAGVSSKMKADEQELQIPHGYLAFNVWRSNGTLVATMGAAAARRLAGPAQTGYFDATSDGHEYRVLAQRSEDGQHHIEVLQHKLSRQAMFDSVMFSSAGLLMPLLIGFPLLLLPVWTAVHTGLKPLRMLTLQLASRKPVTWPR